MGARRRLSQADLDALNKATGTEAVRMFFTGMVKHHQGAITMALQEIADGQNTEAKKLAQDIVDDQREEITTMNQLLTQL